MSINFRILNQFKKIYTDVPSDGKNESLSRAAINVLRRERDGFLVYANDELFAICDTTIDYTFEFVRSISIDDFLQFTEYIKNEEIAKFHIWDLHNNFESNLFTIKEEVHLMETYIDTDLSQKYYLANTFRSTLPLLRNVYSDAFKVLDHNILEKWINEIKNENWFSLDNIYIVGEDTPEAFLILRERSPHILEIFLFGITTNYQKKSLSKKLFSNLLFLVGLKYQLSNIKIQIWVHKSNEVAYRLYEKHNFKPISIRKKYFVNL